ncbi:hypothetical protein [Micromonospora sp. NPDC126480]|uniref:hypothetical protein n=1 Tax=Micromonospora sp. NPDC126480 TaxID=3155312 RepID=UPI00331CD551
MTAEQERDEVMGAAVAFLAAMARDDEAGGEAVLATVNLVVLAVFFAGMIDQIGPVAFGGRERYLEILAAWQPGQRLGDVVE